MSRLTALTQLMARECRLLCQPEPLRSLRHLRELLVWDSGVSQDCETRLVHLSGTAPSPPSVFWHCMPPTLWFVWCTCLGMFGLCAGLTGLTSLVMDYPAPKIMRRGMQYLAGFKGLVQLYVHRAEDIEEGGLQPLAGLPV